MPSERGAISMSRSSLTYLLPSPVRMAAYTAAPYATASSGLIDLFNSFPSKKSFSSSITFGMRVDPPTKITSLI